jgi:hypothetical protein
MQASIGVGVWRCGANGPIVSALFGPLIEWALAFSGRCLLNWPKNRATVKESPRLPQWKHHSRCLIQHPSSAAIAVTLPSLGVPFSASNTTARRCMLLPSPLPRRALRVVASAATEAPPEPPPPPTSPSGVVLVDPFRGPEGAPAQGRLRPEVAQAHCISLGHISGPCSRPIECFVFWNPMG